MHQGTTSESIAFSSKIMHLLVSLDTESLSATVKGF